MRRLAGCLALVALAAAPAPASADATLDAGGLRVEVAAEPFGLRFVDARDGDVLGSVGGPVPAADDPLAAYGPLGFAFDRRQPVVNNAYFGYYAAAEAKLLWFHATRIVDQRPGDGRLDLVAATSDPHGHRLEVSVERVADGVVRLRSRVQPGSGPFADRASVSGAAFGLPDGERHLGFGERSNAVDQTGGSVFSWAEEGPFSSGEAEQVMRPLVPGFTFPTGPTATNFPIPWLVSTRGLGVLIDQPHRSTFHLGDERAGAWRAEAEDGALALTVVAGPKPADVVRRYSSYAGRQPRPRAWILGPWFQPTLEKEPLELARRFRREDVPVSVAQTYTHYLPCGAHVGHRERERRRVRDYHALGYKITTYFNPHVCLDYEPVYSEAARNGWFVKNAAGRPYVLSNPFTADQQISEVDFTNPDARRFYGRLLDEALDDGYDGWMEDFGEYTPTDAHLHDGTTGRESHNRYPVDYHCTSYRHTRERRGNDLAVFIRSGFHGVQPCARVVWGGDPTEDWSCADGLCAAVHQLLNMGLSGVAYQGSDIGGFHAVVNRRTTDELNIRWLQVGAVSGIMRTQANGYSFHRGREQRSQVWHPAVMPVWRRYTKLRTQLFPYLAAASAEYQAGGLPIARQLALVFPDDPRAARAQTEFMFGPDLLAAPVLTEGARTRRLWLPAGEWVDLWDAVRYDDGPGSFSLRRAQVTPGAREVEVDAPLDELPLMARAGALLPLLPPDVDTLATLGGHESVALHERRRHLRILALPRGRSTARFYGRKEGHLVSHERRGSWTLKVRSTRRRLYDLQASMATLRRPLTPCSVRLDGRPLSRRAWRYDTEDRVLHARFRARSARLVVRACR